MAHRAISLPRSNRVAFRAKRTSTSAHYATRYPIVSMLENIGLLILMWGVILRWPL